MENTTVLSFMMLALAFTSVHSQICQDNSPCENNSTCVGGVLGDAYTCQCVFGWQGINCTDELFQFNSRSDGLCGYNLFESSGVIQSPNFTLSDAGLYENNLECYYLVRVHNARQLNFSIDFFETEDVKDYLEYGSGYSKSEDSQFLDGNITTPLSFVVDGSSAWFYFYTDFNVQGRGFSVSLTADVINCASAPCVNNGTCVELDVDYECQCLPGFEGRNCEIDINECESNPCATGEICTEGGGTFSCNCPSGFSGTGCSVSCIRTCRDRIRLRCGSDGRTYLNRCHLQNAKCLDDSITTVSRRPCQPSGIIEVFGEERICLQIGAGGSSSSSSSSESKESVSCPSTQAPPTSTTIMTTQQMLTTAENCQNNCPLVYEPVCGTGNQTFPNNCTLETVQCLSGSTLTFIRNGVCD